MQNLEINDLNASLMTLSEWNLGKVHLIAFSCFLKSNPSVFQKVRSRLNFNWCMYVLSSETNLVLRVINLFFFFHSARFHLTNFLSITELIHSFYLPVSPVINIKQTLFSKVTLTTWTSCFWMQCWTTIIKQRCFLIWKTLSL